MPLDDNLKQNVFREQEHSNTSEYGFESNMQTASDSASVFAQPEESPEIVDAPQENGSQFPVPESVSSDSQKDDSTAKIELFAADLRNIQCTLSELSQAISRMTEKQEKNDRQLTQVLRENVNFQVQVRQGMQRDLDSFKEQQRGEQYIPILMSIASLYSDYCFMLDDDSNSEKSKKNLNSLFEQIADILHEHDAEIVRSAAGNVRQAKVAKVINKVKTGDRKLHNTVIKSLKPGAVCGRKVLCQELVDVFIFDETLIEKQNVSSENNSKDPEEARVPGTSNGSEEPVTAHTDDLCRQESDESETAQ